MRIYAKLAECSLVLPRWAVASLNSAVVRSDGSKEVCMRRAPLLFPKFPIHLYINDAAPFWGDAAPFLDIVIFFERFF